MIDRLEILDILERSEFPVVDFMFQNRGSGKSLLRRFVIHVDAIELDAKPVFESTAVISPYDKEQKPYRFQGGSIKGDLLINLKNKGWGPAVDIDISLPTPLSEIFTNNSQTSLKKIESGETIKSGLRLDSSNIDISALSHYLKLPDNRDEILFRGVPERPDGHISIDNLSANLTYEDKNNGKHKSEINVSMQGLPRYGGLFLSRTGFNWLWEPEPNINACMSMPEAIYYACLDPEKGSTQKSYKISHIVSSGDIEHLNIMIGAEKSCQAKLRFEFDVDGDKTISSDPFDIKIWNPLGSRYHSGLTNGDELLSKMKKEYLIQIDKTKNDDLERFWSRRFDRDDVEHSGFPFMRPKPKDVW